MEKVLVVFYSYTGTSRRLALRLARLQGWRMGEIEEEMPRRGLKGTLRCLADSLWRRHPDIEYRGPSPQDFDLVVLVSPIWAYRLAAPMRSFLMRMAPKLRDIAVLSVQDRGGAAHAVAEVTALTHRAPRRAAAFLRQDILDGSYEPRLKSFGHALLRSSPNGDASETSRLSPRTA